MGSPMPSRRMLPVGRVGVEPTVGSPRFELGRFAGLRTVPFRQRLVWGSNPPAPDRQSGRDPSRVTRRKNTPHHHPVAQVGVEPTAFEILSLDGRPVAYRASFVSSGGRNRTCGLLIQSQGGSSCNSFLCKNLCPVLRAVCTRFARMSRRRPVRALKRQKAGHPRCDTRPCKLLFGRRSSVSQAQRMSGKAFRP